MFPGLHPAIEAAVLILLLILGSGLTDVIG